MKLLLALSCLFLATCERFEQPQDKLGHPLHPGDVVRDPTQPATVIVLEKYHGNGDWNALARKGDEVIALPLRQQDVEVDYTKDREWAHRRTGYGR